MKTKLFLTLLLSLVFYLLSSQIPQGFNYQAVARDAVSGNPITDPIDVNIAILAADASTVIREEQHSAVDPDEHGLFSLVIGQGTWLSGLANFSSIDWTVTPKYIRTSIYYDGGWKILDPAQLWSVPYSHHSETSGQWISTGSDIYRAAGKVGINTASPAAVLDVNGESIFRGTIIPGWIEMGAYATGDRFSGIDFHSDDIYTDYGLRLIRYNTGEDANSRLHHRGKGGLELYNQEAAPIRFFTTAASRMIIGSTGNVGINNDSPSYRLDVNGEITSRSFNGLRLRQSSYSTILRNDNAALYLLLTNSGDPDGTWNSLRPFTVNLSTGSVNIGNGALNVTHGGNIGVGTASTTTKMVVQPAATWSDEVPLFEVKNKYGIPVFAVFNNGVKINIEHDPDGFKGPKGGFAIGGYDYTKGGTVTLMNITPDSIRFNINNDNTKGPKGGFAIGGFDYTKGDINEDFMHVTPLQSTVGQYNTFLGYQAGINSTNGWNTFIGYRCGVSNTGASNVFIGHGAGEANQGGNINVFIGKNAGNDNISGSENTYVGLGAGSLNQSGSENTFIGGKSGLNNGGEQNTLIGSQSMPLNTTGSYNVAVGYQSGYQNTGGSRNIFLGYKAGRNESGSDRIYIDGSGEGVSNTTSLIYGYYGVGSKFVRINGDFFYTGDMMDISDARLKTDLRIINNAVEKIKSMNGYYFNWSDEATENLEVNETRKQIGVVAQEVEDVFPELVSVSEEGYKMVDYIKLTPILIQAVKEQQEQIDSQQQQIDELKAIIGRMGE